MNTALRGEMAVFRQALQAVKDRGTLKAWEVKAMQAASDAHLEHIHAHHHNEDNLLGPEFAKRFKFDKVSVCERGDETSASIYYRSRLDVLTSRPRNEFLHFYIVRLKKNTRSSWVSWISLKR
jgi:hypothetical protein